MRIYTKQAPVLIKLEFSRQGEDKASLTLCESTFDEAYDFLEQQASAYGSSIKKGRATQVRVREYIGGVITKGRDKMFSFHGLNPKEFQEILLSIIPTE